MFTIQQIKSAHAKVKSGADFPAYIQELKTLGISAYRLSLTDGGVTYQGANGYSITGGPKYEDHAIINPPDRNALSNSLAIHQKGETDYPTFCLQAIAAGVAYWLIDMAKMTCTYYDIYDKEIIREQIPQA